MATRAATRRALILAYVRASAGGGAGTWAPSKLDLVLRSTRRAFGDPMFFTFPEERALEQRATDRRVGVETASTAEGAGAAARVSAAAPGAVHRRGDTSKPT